MIVFLLLFVVVVANFGGCTSVINVVVLRILGVDLFFLFWSRFFFSNWMLVCCICFFLFLWTERDISSCWLVSFVLSFFRSFVFIFFFFVFFHSSAVYDIILFYWLSHKQHCALSPALQSVCLISLFLFLLLLFFFCIFLFRPFL